MAPADPTTHSSSKPDPQYRPQDHLVFAALALPIFAVSIVIIALVVTIGTR